MPWWAPWRRSRRRLNPPSALDGLSDELVILLLSRAPFMTHGTLHVVCRRLKKLLRSSEFRQHRVECGLAEYGLVLAGGIRYDEQPIAECSTLTARGRWRSITPLSGVHAFGCSAILENEDGQPEMWMMGGRDRHWNPLATVEVYNLRTNTWRSCLPLSQPRQGAVAGVVGGRLVVAGGYGGYDDDAAKLTSVEAYTSTGWIPLPPLPHAAWNATACVLDGRLYVMGGIHCDKLQVLEFSEEKRRVRRRGAHGGNPFSWTVKGNLPAKRDSAASAVFDGKIWLMGGVVYAYDDDGDEVQPDNGPATVVIYDVQNDTWATGPELPRGICGCDAQILAGEIHVTGENDNGEPMTFRYGGHGWEEVPNFNDEQGMRYGAMRQSLLLG